MAARHASMVWVPVCGTHPPITAGGTKLPCLQVWAYGDCKSTSRQALISRIKQLSEVPGANQNQALWRKVYDFMEYGIWNQ